MQQCVLPGKTNLRSLRWQLLLCAAAAMLAMLLGSRLVASGGHKRCASCFVACCQSAASCRLLLPLHAVSWLPHCHGAACPRASRAGRSAVTYVSQQDILLGTG